MKKIHCNERMPEKRIKLFRSKRSSCVVEDQMIDDQGPVVIGSRENKPKLSEEGRYSKR